MQQISGIVCVAEVQEWILLHKLFGPAASGARGAYAYFEANGLRPWAHRADAEQAQRALEKRGVRSLLHRLRVVLADTEADLRTFHHRRSLIIALLGSDGGVLYGPLRPRCIRTCDRLARLEENGLETFRVFDEALFAAMEMKRQMPNEQVRLATFSLTKIRSPR